MLRYVTRGWCPVFLCVFGVCVCAQVHNAYRIRTVCVARGIPHMKSVPEACPKTYVFIVERMAK